MITHVPKSGTDWIPKVTPSTAVDPVYFYGCKTVQELSDYYRLKKQRGFCAPDLVAAIVGSNDGFSDYPIPANDWPKVQLAIALLGIDARDRPVLENRGLFSRNRGYT